MSEHESGNADGDPLPFRCPHCQGPLRVHIHDGQVIVQCEAGHAYTPREVSVEQTEVVARAIWSAARALEDRVRQSEWMLSDLSLARWVDSDSLRQQVEQDKSTIDLLRQLGSAADRSIVETFEQDVDDGDTEPPRS